MPKSGAALIVKERKRQIDKEGWDANHDDEHWASELAAAAECYIGSASQHRYRRTKKPPEGWPWEARWWKPKDPIRDLVRAGALIAAEIDRLQRAGDPPPRRPREEK